LRRFLPLFTDVNEIMPASRATRWLRSDYAGKNKRTGKPFASEFAHVSTIVDGKFTSFKEFTDTAAVLAASTA